MASGIEDGGRALAKALEQRGNLTDWQKWKDETGGLQHKASLMATPTDRQTRKSQEALQLLQDKGTSVALAVSDTNNTIAGGMASAIIHSWVWASIPGTNWSGNGNQWGVGIGTATFGGTLVTSLDSLDTFCNQTASFNFVAGSPGAGVVLMNFSDGNDNTIGVATLASGGLIGAIGFQGDFSWSQG